MYRFASFSLFACRRVTGISHVERDRTHLAQTRRYSSVGLGYTVTSGEPYYVPGCTTMAQSQQGQWVFYNALIPQSAWSVPAQRMLQYIPAPNSADGTFATSAYDQILRDDKGATRVDANTVWDCFRLTTSLTTSISTIPTAARAVQRKVRRDTRIVPVPRNREVECSVAAVGYGHRRVTH
jgi:hypothetical protein